MSKKPMPEDCWEEQQQVDTIKLERSLYPQGKLILKKQKIELLHMLVPAITCLDRFITQIYTNSSELSLNFLSIFLPSFKSSGFNFFIDTLICRKHPFLICVCGVSTFRVVCYKCSRIFFIIRVIYSAHPSTKYIIYLVNNFIALYCVRTIISVG